MSTNVADLCMRRETTSNLALKLKTKHPSCFEALLLKHCQIEKTGQLKYTHSLYTDVY